jgi:hypothetical protein
MPSSSEPDDDRSGQAESAAELADRAAESVGRRYDPTKEVVLGDRDREGRDRAAEEDTEEAERDDNDDNDGGRPI